MNANWYNLKLFVIRSLKEAANNVSFRIWLLKMNNGFSITLCLADFGLFNHRYCRRLASTQENFVMHLLGFQGYSLLWAATEYQTVILDENCEQLDNLKKAFAKNGLHWLIEDKYFFIATMRNLTYLSHNGISSNLWKIFLDRLKIKIHLGN